MVISSKRPKNVALFSFIVSLLSFGTVFFLGSWNESFAVSVISWLILYVALVWFILCIQFYQRTLAEQEKLDLSQLAGEEKSSTIFQAKGGHAELFSVAQGRLKILEKWFIPIFSVFIGVYQIVLGVILLKTAFSDDVEIQPNQPLYCSIILTAVAFVSFLLSRYATGMSAQKEWRPLRAGGSSMLGATLLCFALAIVLALVHLFPDNMIFVLGIMAKVVPVVMFILGAEIAINLIMDIYRPRMKDKYNRTAFDSRLLGIINEPGGILRSAADALDYQFGFQVSQTWFYKLLEKWVFPLILFGIVTLYALSCIVVVNPGEQAIIEYFGNPVNSSDDVRIIDSGLTFKWPWPIEKVYKYPIERIAEIGIGYKESEAEKKENTPKLWGQKHYEEEYLLLVASEKQKDVSSEIQETDSNDTSVPPVNLVNASVPVQYRIKDLYSFIYKHEFPEEILKSICYRELTKYAASARLKTEGESDSEFNLLGKGRIKAAEVLKEKIQAAADKENLGVEIVFLGLQGVHPPIEVAKDYQAVTGAIQEQQSVILKAQAEKIKLLSTSAGSVAKAEELEKLIIEIAKFERSEDPNQSKIDDLRQQLDEAFDQASGESYQIFNEAITYAFTEKILTEAEGVRFKGQLKAYRAAPGIYKLEQRIFALEGSLQNIRKYVIMADEERKQITVIDLQEKIGSGLSGIDLGELLGPGQQESGGQ